MTAQVRTTPEADADILRIDAWWREHRHVSRDLFSAEIRDTFAVLAASPNLGHRHAHRRIRGVRRLLLRATRYHLYYLFDGGVVTVLAVWSCLRRRGPSLAPR